MLFLYFYGDITYYMHAFIYILCHCIHIIHVIYPHIHVNMYVMYSCKYFVNKLKLKLKHDIRIEGQISPIEELQIKALNESISIENNVL